MRLMSAALMLTLASCAPSSAPPAAETDPAAAEPSTPTTTPEATAPEAMPEPQITGGYAPANLEDEMVKAAQTVAVNEIYKRDPTRALVEAVEVEQQVVAGLNYRFTITMTGGAKFGVTVFRNLQGAMEVTDYAKLP
jgi:hypothetical protein